MSAKNDRCYIAAFVSGLLGIILLRVEKHKKGSAVTLINVMLCYAVLYCSTNYYFNSDYYRYNKVYVTLIHLTK